MTDKEKIIFQPELDLTKLDQDAAAVERRLLAMYRQVQSLGAQEKKRFTDQLGIIEQLQLREARLQQLRSKANTTQRVTQFNNAIQQTQREMQRLTTVTTAETVTVTTTETVTVTTVETVTVQATTTQEPTTPEEEPVVDWLTLFSRYLDELWLWIATLLAEVNS